MSVLENFQRAIENNDIATVTSLITDGAVDVNARLCIANDENPTALEYAAWLGFWKIVAILLQANARIDDMRKLLEFALSYGDYEIAWFLIHSGASLETIDHRYLCKFSVAKIKNLRVLIERGVVIRNLSGFMGESPLYSLLYFRGNNDEEQMLHMLVNVCGVDLESRIFGGYGYTVLLKTVDSDFYQNQNSRLRWLINAGADVDSVRHDGASALHLVRNYECAISLLAAGADVTIKNQNGRLAIVHAVLKRRKAIVAALFSAGADLDTADSKGKTARNCFVRRGVRIKADEIDAAQKDIAKSRLDFVRYRALQVCIALQSLNLPALQLCEIMLFSCGAVAPLIRFHQWWSVATSVKHFVTKSETTSA